MAPDPDALLVVDVARLVVAELAPEEMVVFPHVSAAYFEPRHGRRRRSTGPDDILGFGVAEAATFLTPVALSVLVDVVNYLRTEVLRAIKTESSAAVDHLVSGAFRRLRPHATPAPVTALTADQLREVRRIALEKARTLRLRDDRAELLADAIVGSLVHAG
jgi:hypothetical protein